MKKQHKKTIIITAISAGIVLFVCIDVFCNLFGNLQKPSLNTMHAISSVSQAEKDITMKQALKIGYSAATKWDSNAKIMDIISTDSFDHPDINSGRNGKRRVWNLYFKGRRKQEHQYYIRIVSDKIAVHKRVLFSDYKGFDYSKIKVDSTKAVRLAIKNKHLTPGKTWAVGYHFDLEYQSYYPDSKKKYLAIEVYGLSPKGNFAHVDIDEKTGKIIYAGEETYDKKGNAKWTKF